MSLRSPHLPIHDPSAAPRYSLNKVRTPHPGIQAAPLSDSDLLSSLTHSSQQPGSSRHIPRMGFTFHLCSFHMSLSFPGTALPFPYLSKSCSVLTTKQKAVLTLKSRVTVPAKSDFPFYSLLQLSAYTTRVLPVTSCFHWADGSDECPFFSGLAAYVTALSIILTPTCKVKHHYQ